MDITNEISVVYLVLESSLAWIRSFVTEIGDYQPPRLFNKVNFRKSCVAKFVKSGYHQQKSYSESNSASNKTTWASWKCSGQDLRRPLLIWNSKKVIFRKSCVAKFVKSGYHQQKSYSESNSASNETTWASWKWSSQNLRADCSVLFTVMFQPNFRDHSGRKSKIEDFLYGELDESYRLVYSTSPGAQPSSWSIPTKQRVGPSSQPC